MRVPFEIPPGVTLETDVSLASWVDERLFPWRGAGEGVLVGELVPTGFESYGRILHPARRRDATEGGEADPVTWADVALERGKRIHPEVHFQALVGQPLDHRVTESDEFWMPDEGSVPIELCTPLIGILSRHTKATSCLFCLWDGFGFLHEGSSANTVAFGADFRGRMQRRAMRRAARRRSQRAWAAMAPIPRVQIHPTPDRRGAFREYFLFRGALGSLASFVFTPGRHFQSPNIWWPEDRAWVVATEIDDWTTYVGGTRACIEDLLASGDLEVVPSDPGFRWDVRGDSINLPNGL